MRFPSSAGASVRESARSEVLCCVLGELIAVRDSKDPDGPKLFFTQAEWDAFLNSVKAHEFDRS